MIFHGVNKSGSLAMATVMRDAYYSEGRAHRFVCSYFGIPRVTTTR